MGDCPDCLYDGVVIHFQTSKGKDDTCPRCNGVFVYYRDKNAEALKRAYDQRVKG